jgi:hypothetical protein
MKWMTVQEYAILEGIALSAAYKRVKQGRVKAQRKFGKLVVGVREKQEA